MTTSLSDAGLQFADTNTITSLSAMPTTGTYTIGNLILNKNAATNAKLLGWKRLTAGSSHVLNTDWLEITSGITVTTPQTTTSGTTKDFTGIPVWAKRITVIFTGVSLSGTNDLLVQLGTSGGFVSTGYISTGIRVTNAASSGGGSSTSGMVISSSAAANTVSGHMILTTDGSNNWVSSHTAKSATTLVSFGGGDIALGGTLTQVRITPSGADTFDAGSINITYE